MSYNLEGTVKVIGTTQSFDSGFKKREVVITSNDDKYPQDIKLEFTNDGVTKLDEFKVGDAVKVAFSVRGNEYQGKYYVNLSAYAIAFMTPSTNTLTAPTTAEIKAKEVATNKKVTTVPEEEDDLPF